MSYARCETCGKTSMYQRPEEWFFLSHRDASGIFAILLRWCSYQCFAEYTFPGGKREERAGAQ